MKIPDGLDFDRAAGLIIIYATALHALQDRANPKAGETMVVLGAAGGTGLAAIEIGKLVGPARRRLRLVGREARVLQEARRRRSLQLREGRSEGRAEEDRRRERHRHRVRSGRRRFHRSRRCARSAGKAGCW